MERLIVSWLAGTASAQEEEQLRAWRAQSPGNERLFQDLARLWNAVPAALPPAAVPPVPDVHELIGRAGIRPLSARRSLTRVRLRRWVLLSAATAAAVALAVSAPWIMSGKRFARTFSVDEFATGPSGISTVTLNDGTVVRLGPRTRLRLGNKGGGREVKLEGQAFFAVAHDPRHPFSIVTPAGTVSAVGTRFDLQAGGDNLSLALLEGRVVLTTPGAEVVLGPGQATQVVDGITLPVIRIPDTDRLLRWMGNFLAFQETPLKDAVIEIARHYHLRVEIGDSVLANRTVTAWFTDRTADEVLRIVCAATLAECSTTGDLVTMRAAR